MKRIIITTFLVSILITAFAQKRDSMLIKAYNEKSVSKLDSFFENWREEFPSIVDSELAKCDDTIKNVYTLFQLFYNPLDLERIGGSEWGNDIYSNVKYLLTQNTIEYGFVDTLDMDLIIQRGINNYVDGDNKKYAKLLKHYNGDTESVKEAYIVWPDAKQYFVLNNFRPKLKFTKPKSVILNTTYSNLLYKFLGDNFQALGTNNIMSPAKSIGGSADRQKFLENDIKIWYGHWGGYWQFDSYPLVKTITFDSTFEHALVDFRMVYEGGYAYYKKVKGVWTLFKAKRTWIE